MTSARLRPPHASTRSVPRTALVGRLKASAQSLVLVSAPAGYGKTTVVRQWLDGEERPAAWLRLESLHNDPVAFLSYLAEAIATIAHVDPVVGGLLSVRQPPIEARVLPELADAVEDAPPFILVLDDAHLLTSKTAWRYVTLLFDALRSRSRLAITARTDPPLPLARLRAEDDLLELRVSDLRMDREETAELLRLHDRDLDDEPLEDIVEITEGWPAGLYLALLADEKVTADVHGDLHGIAEYLTSEVLDRQPEDLREFMLRTAVLDQLSAGSCTAVTGRQDAHRLLDRLARENLFLTPLDDRDRRFRYHHLFGALLSTELLRRAPEELGDLHRRAAAWYEAEDDLERAVRHYVEASDGDRPHVAELAAVACDRHVARGRFELARSLLECFSDRQIETLPALGLTAGYLSLYMDDPRVRRLGRHALAATVSFDPAPLGLSSLRGWQVILRANGAPDGVTRMLEDAELGCAMEARGDFEWLNTVEALRVVALYLLGRVQRATALIGPMLLRQDLGEMRAWWLGMRTLIAADQDDWQLAQSLDAEARRTHADWPSLPPMLGHALVLARSHDPGTMSYIESAEKDFSGVFSATAWRHILGADVFGEAALHMGDRSAAERWTAEAESALAMYPDAGILHGRTKRLREALEERRMADPLTAAERRVLDLLSTQLTAGQMAARLFLTTNTVKSHMNHIYRKLGVTTRTDAVERARDLGLL